MKELAHIFHTAVMAIGLSALAAIGAFFAARLFKGVAGHLIGGLGGSSLVALAFVAGVVYYGGGKSSFSFDMGLRDNGSYATNDTVHVAWTYVGIPSASSVYIAYRETGTTNAWDDLGETVASALSWDATVQNATNYDYLVYSTYVPPAPVHTNGVWQGPVYETKRRVRSSEFIVIGAEVRKHGKAIAPPNAKRKEDEDE